MRRVDPEKHEEKKRQILQAAERCFSRDGFRGARIADICAEADISPGHLYHYFENKESIIAMMADLGMERVARRFDDMIKKPNVVSAFVAEFDHLRRARRRPDPSLVLEVMAEASRNPAIARIVQMRSQKLQDLLAGFLRVGQERGQVDPDLEVEPTAAILLSVIDAAKTLRIKDPKSDAATSTELLKRMVFRFLAPSR